MADDQPDRYGEVFQCGNTVIGGVVVIILCVGVCVFNLLGQFLFVREIKPIYIYIYIDEIYALIIHYWFEKC